MRYMGGCTECFTVWWGCRCPLRCEECGAGYRDDGNSNCGTPGCKTGQRRGWAMQDRWDAELEASRAEIQCEAVEPAPAEPKPVAQGDNATLPPSLAEAEMGWRITTSSEPGPAEPERGSQNATPSPASRRAPAQNGQGRKPTARSTARPSSRPDKPAHRPVAERRAAVEALLAEGLSDREIARRAGVSPSTVSAVRKGQQAAKFGV